MSRMLVNKELWRTYENGSLEPKKILSFGAGAQPMAGFRTGKGKIYIETKITLSKSRSLINQL